MLPSHTGLPKDFVGLLMGYFAQISEAIRKNSHHDHRRALLIEFIRKAFGIEIDEIELELKVKAAEARGRIDAFYKFVIFELKVDMEKERADAVRELKKYFESRETPEDYIAVVTDGLRFEIYDYDPATRKPLPIRQFEINIDRPELVYRQLDELLTSGKKIPPSSDDIVGRFDLTSTSFSRSLRRLEEAFEAVAEDTASKSSPARGGLRSGS